MVTDPKYLNDTNYHNIGDVPTGFIPYADIGLKEIFVRPFNLTELPLIHLTAVSDRGITHLVRAVNACCSVDVNLLTDGDFSFVLAWLRKSSYPEGPTFVRWGCVNQTMFVRGTKEIVLDAKEEDMRSKNLEYRPCGRKNNELVHQAVMRITSLDDDFEKLPDFMDFPRVATLQEMQTLKKARPEDVPMAEYARWIKAGKNLDEKLEALDTITSEQFIQLMKISKSHYHGVYENLPLRCRSCNYRTTYRNNINFTSFFADNSDKNILDIQYSLLAEFGLQPDLNMPVKQLLYHNSCLAKDRQEEEEKRRLLNAVKKRTGG